MGRKTPSHKIQIIMPYIVIAMHTFKEPIVFYFLNPYTSFSGKQDRCYYFIDEKTGSKRSGHLLKVTDLGPESILSGPNLGALFIHMRTLQ